MKSYKTHWNKLISREMSGYRSLAGDDPFHEWHMIFFPERRAERPLVNAIEVLCGDGDQTVANAFLTNSISIANRTLSEKLCQRSPSSETYPVNLARVERVAAYSEWLKSDTAIPTDLIQQSIGHILEYASAPPIDSDTEVQSMLLSAVSMSLLDSGRQTQDALGLVARYRKKKPELSAVCNLASFHLSGHAPSEQDVSNYENRFDAVRRPTRSEVLLSFEMAYIHRLVLGNTRVPPSSREAVALMSS